MLKFRVGKVTSTENPREKARTEEGFIPKVGSLSVWDVETGREFSFVKICVGQIMEMPDIGDLVLFLDINGKEFWHIKTLLAKGGVERQRDDLQAGDVVIQDNQGKNQIYISGKKSAIQYITGVMEEIVDFVKSRIIKRVGDYILESQEGGSIRFEDDGTVVLSKQSPERKNLRDSAVAPGKEKEFRELQKLADERGIRIDKDGSIKIFSNDPTGATEIARVKIDKAGNVEIFSETGLVFLNGKTEPLIRSNAFMALFNAHTHIGNLGAPTLPPTEQMTPAQLSNKNFTG